MQRPASKHRTEGWICMGYVELFNDSCRGSTYVRVRLQRGLPALEAPSVGSGSLDLLWRKHTVILPIFPSPGSAVHSLRSSYNCYIFLERTLPPKDAAVTVLSAHHANDAAPEGSHFVFIPHRDRVGHRPHCPTESYLTSGPAIERSQGQNSYPRIRTWGCDRRVSLNILVTVLSWSPTWPLFYHFPYEKGSKWGWISCK